jgi:hypothetical protein
MSDKTAAEFAAELKSRGFRMALELSRRSGAIC